jgi:hypothetical protein
MFDGKAMDTRKSTGKTNEPLSSAAVGGRTKASGLTPSMQARTPSPLASGKGSPGSQSVPRAT